MDAETKVNNLTDLVGKLTLALNNSGVLNNPKPTTHDRTLNIDVPDFGGTTSNPDDYIEWENSIERYFEFKETPEDQRFRLAKVKLVKLSAIWLEGLQRQRKREDR